MRINLRNKIMGGYGLAILFTLFIGIFGAKGLISTTGQYKELMDGLQPKIDQIKLVDELIMKQAVEELDFLLSGGEESFVTKIKGDRDEILKLLNELEVDATGKMKKDLANTLEKYEAYYSSSMKVINTFQAGDREGAKNISFGESRIKREEVISSLDEHKKDMEKLMKEADKKIDKTVQRNIFIFIAVIIAATIVNLLIGYIISGEIVKPVRELLRRSTIMASGNLSIDKLKIKRDDEIKDLAIAFNTMVDKLKDLIKKIIFITQDVTTSTEQLTINADEASKATEQVARAIQEVAAGNMTQSMKVNDAVEAIARLAEGIEKISQGARDQSENVSRTNIIVSQVAKAIDEIAGNAQEVSETARQTSDAALKGENAVNFSIKGMENIKSKVFDAAEKIKELGEQSKKIGEIIQVIDDIAEQTNLLALNAAIEAARAGEHGKGFAIVADEVRKLAERSSQATKEIADLISSIQRGTDNAVFAMNEGTAEVEKGFQLALDAGEALKEILSTVEKTYNQVQNISSAAEEIAASSNEVVNAIDIVAKITDDNSLATEQMAENSRRVNLAMEEIASISQESSAAAEEVSATTEEMTAQNTEIANSAKNLFLAIENLNEVIGNFKIRKSKQRCWEIKNCPDERIKKCPAYKHDDERCWLIDGTWCGGVQQGNAEAKRHTCMNCDAYKVIMGFDEKIKKL